jgi:predicted GNAT superfamily acetyltransferase
MMTPTSIHQIEIRPAHEWEDFLQCEELQREAWQMPDEREIVPAHLLITLAKNGGLVLCAFDGARVVGFVFGFLGSEGEGNSYRIKHCSHQLGVLPEYRALGLGAELKKRQREQLIEQGLNLATWTYDPLQAVNARLNLGHLGAIARRYLRDAYGELKDALNAGVATDRFEVEWWLSSHHVRARLNRNRVEPSTEASSIYEIEFGQDELPRIAREIEFGEKMCAVEIPADYNSLKARDLPLGREWRERTRATFERAFHLGYAATDVERWLDARGRARVRYILTQDVGELEAGD